MNKTKPLTQRNLHEYCRELTVSGPCVCTCVCVFPWAKAVAAVLVNWHLVAAVIPQEALDNNAN